MTRGKREKNMIEVTHNSIFEIVICFVINVIMLYQVDQLIFNIPSLSLIYYIITFVIHCLIKEYNIF